MNHGQLRRRGVLARNSHAWVVEAALGRLRDQAPRSPVMIPRILRRCRRAKRLLGGENRGRFHTQISPAGLTSGIRTSALRDALVPDEHQPPGSPRRLFFSPESNEESMKVLVAVKRVVDYNMSNEPFLRNLREEAVRLKEQGVAARSGRFPLAPPAPRNNAVRQLGAGADRAILVESAEEAELPWPWPSAQGRGRKEQPQLVIPGQTGH
ncbi:hypothetical protein FQR65_LT18037 [Abscondita terminalis]|nr:hypothetical protein FQR65_LT18037 [Abscondita terminalis]